MSRDVPYDPDSKCDNCGKLGAFDFMGDCYCDDCISGKPKAGTMLTISFINDGTGTEQSANYVYEIRVNEKQIERGEIKNHNRADGWINLLKLLIDRKEKSNV